MEASPVLALLFVACQPSTVQEESGKASATLESTTQPTIFRYAWDSPEPAASRVEYGTGGAYDHASVAVDSEDGLHHEVTLALGAGEVWSWRVMDGDVEGASGEQAVDPAPDGLPQFTVTVGAATADGGFVIGTSPESPEGSSLWVVDSAGRYVWWRFSAAPNVEVTQAWPGLDPAWIEWIERAPGPGIRRARVDGSEEERIELPAAHHDFVQLPDGGYAAIERQESMLDGQVVVGDGIVEVSASGQAHRAFDAAEQLTLDLADLEDIGDGLEVMHGNGLTYDVATNRYYLSSWCRNSILAIDRATGALIWELGGPHSDFELLAGTPFAAQHAPRIDGDALMVFDNGPMDELSSRVAAFEVDEAAKTYTQLWEDAPEPTLYTPVLGNADRQPDGSLFISWGATGRMELLDAALAPTWRLDASLGGAVGYAHHLPTFSGSPG